jgi:hypothetical protein
LAVAAYGAVGLRNDERNLMPGGQQGIERGHGELRRAAKNYF